MDPSLDESVVDELCDRVIALLQSWKAVFDILDKGGTPTDKDKSDLEEALGCAIDKHRVTNSPFLTPKGHTMDGHAHEQFCYHTNLPLIVEQFVERNHQELRKIELRVKRMPDATKRGETTAKRKAFETIGDIDRHIQLVHDATARGKYVMSGKYSKKAKTSHHTEELETPALARTAAVSNEITPVNTTGVSHAAISITPFRRDLMDIDETVCQPCDRDISDPNDESSPAAESDSATRPV